MNWFELHKSLLWTKCVKAKLREKNRDAENILAALQLSVRNDNVNMVKALLGHLKGIFHCDPLLHKLDDDGNTIIHLAVAGKQLQIIEMLLENESPERRRLIVNAKNRDGFRALDILDMVSETREQYMKIEETLRKAGALRAGEKEHVSKDETELTELEFSMDRRYEFVHRNRSQLLVKRFSRMLIGAALIAATTLHAALNPPSKDKLTTADPVWYQPFVWLNSGLFFSTISFITIILYGLPIKLWLHISVLAATGAYICAVLAVAPEQIAGVIYIGTIVFSAALFRGPVMLQKMLESIQFSDSGAKDAKTVLFTTKSVPDTLLCLYKQNGDI